MATKSRDRVSRESDERTLSEPLSRNGYAIHTYDFGGRASCTIRLTFAAGEIPANYPDSDPLNL